MAQKGKYKQTERGERELVAEENYAAGMFTSETPLGEGYCKTMVNLIPSERTDKLVPRRGYKTTEEASIDLLY